MIDDEPMSLVESDSNGGVDQERTDFLEDLVTEENFWFRMTLLTLILGFITRRNPCILLTLRITPGNYMERSNASDLDYPDRRNPTWSTVEPCN